MVNSYAKGTAMIHIGTQMNIPYTPIWYGETRVDTDQKNLLKGIDILSLLVAIDKRDGCIEPLSITLREEYII